MMLARTTVAAFLMFALGAAASDAGTNNLMNRNLSTAEALIDAFYSFDAEQLKPFLTEAPASAAALLYYQGWAEGGNYVVLQRNPCIARTAEQVHCAITVQDDPVLALETGFNVTDTFTLTFEGPSIISIETSSNDQPIYHEARAWVIENMPEVMTGPCKGFFGDGKTPGDCARAITEGYRLFMAQRRRDAKQTARSADP